MPTQQPDPRAGLSLRARAVADWISHHALELAAVTATGALGALSPAYLAISGAAGMLWGAHEWRASRHNARTAPAPELDAAAPVEQPAQDSALDRHSVRGHL